MIMGQGIPTIEIKKGVSEVVEGKEKKREGGRGEGRETEQVSTREQSLLEKRNTLSQGARDLLIP